MIERLSSSRIPFLAALVALLLCLPALWGGWAMDDYYHRAGFLRPPALEGIRGALTDATPSGFFRFLDGNPEHLKAGMAFGSLPWWTLPVVRAQFYRPLTFFTHWLDYRLWPNSAPLMHAQSLWWFGALVLVAALLYRRFMGPTAAAGLAALLFAIDQTHGLPAGWLANRNAVIATLFGMLALAAYDRTRREGWRAGRFLGPLLFGLGLLAAEAGISAGAFLIAHAVFLDEAPWPSRVKALLPYGVIGVVWRLAATRMGVGTLGIGLYADPGQNPLGFVVAVGQRAPLLLLGQLSPLPADAGYILRADAYRWLWAAGLLVTLLFVAAVVPLLRKDRTARLFALGAALSLLPVCAAFPDDRLMLMPGFGILAVLAQWLLSIGSRWKQIHLRSRVIACGFGGPVLFHFAIAPVMLPYRASGFVQLYRPMYLQVPLDDTVARQSLVVVSAPVAFLASDIPVVRAVDGQAPPRFTRVLCPSIAAMSIFRPDDRTLELTPRGGYLATPVDALFRSREFPFRVGDRVTLPDVTIEVVSLTADARPASIRCRFSVPLEDSSLRWLAWGPGGYYPFVPPPAGGRVELPPAIHI